MTAGGNVLILADEPMREQLCRGLGEMSHSAVSDPYEALSEMGRRSWPAVVLAGPRPQFDALCRAARRLCGQAGLYAVCPPAGEPRVRPLLGQPLDDYFIWPLEADDLAELRRAAGAPAGRRQASHAHAEIRQAQDAADRPADARGACIPAGG